MANTSLYTTLGMATIVAIAPAHAAEWLTDLDAAKAKALAENKLILVDFTGSDWCGWCIRMRSTILNTPAFQQYAADKFVLMEVDVPRNVNKIGAELHARNVALAKHYNITSYPSVLVLSPDGRIQGGFIGGRDTIQHVITPLNEALENKEKASRAESLSGEAKAKALMEIYKGLHKDLKPYFRPLRDEIAALDPENTTGIRTEIADTTQLEQLQQNINKAGNNYHKALALLDKAYTEATPENKKKIDTIRLNYLSTTHYNLMMSANSTDDVLKIKELVLKMAEYSPEGDAKALRHEANTMFNDPEAVLKTLKAKQKAK